MKVLDMNIIKEIITLHDTFSNTFLYRQKALQKKVNKSHSVKSFSRRSRFFFSSSI